MLGLLKRTVKYRNPDMMVWLYKSLVLPHLEYPSPVWRPHYIKQSKAKQSKRGLDEGAGRSLYALQITYNIICTNCTLLIKIINETYIKDTLLLKKWNIVSPAFWWLNSWSSKFGHLKKEGIAQIWLNCLRWFEEYIDLLFLCRRFSS